MIWGVEIFAKEEQRTKSTALFAPKFFGVMTLGMTLYLAITNHNEDNGWAALSSGGLTWKDFSSVLVEHVGILISLCLYGWSHQHGADCQMEVDLITYMSLQILETTCWFPCGLLQHN